LTATGTVYLQPDFSTLRVLPYATDSAIVFGTLHDDNSFRTTSDLCCRSMLRRVVEQARDLHHISFTVGLELEFTLHDSVTYLPIDKSSFANVTLLNQQQAFISSVYDAFIAQEISVELVHAESSNGQMEVVLEYNDDPVQVADDVILVRESIIAIAHQYNMKAIFLPKIFDHQAGNG
jgi:glutamine synthetase